MFTKLKITLIIIVSISLFACTTTSIKKQKKESNSPSKFLKEDISQLELNNIADYKRYYYVCKNLETGDRLSLTTYFPLSRESRMKDNFGFYFQLNGGKAIPFDHIENRELNAKGTRFEVIYRSYSPIENSIVDLIARQHSSTYYKYYQGVKKAWLNCKEG